VRGRPAPPIVEGVSPFRTPGTRRSWGSGAEWTAHAKDLHEGRISAKIYAARAAHLDELARHPDFLEAQPLEDLELVRAALLLFYRPVKGSRAGTSYERVLVTVNNAIGRAHP